MLAVLVSRIIVITIALSAVTGILAINLSFIPAWEEPIAAVILIGLLAPICGALFLLLRQEVPSVFQSNSGLLLVIILNTLASFIFIIGLGGAGGSPIFTSKVSGLHGYSLYLYEDGCYIPDSKFECSNFSSEIRGGSNWLPITSTIYRCKCYFGEATVKAGVVDIPFQEKHEGPEKHLKITLKSGDFVIEQPEKPS